MAEKSICREIQSAVANVSKPLPHLCMFYYISLTVDQELFWLMLKWSLYFSKRRQKVLAKKMKRFLSVIVQRDSSSKLSWKIKSVNNLLNLCKDPSLWTVDPHYTTENTLLHLFTIPLSIIYSLFSLAIMMQMLCFWGSGQKNARKKSWDTLSNSFSSEQNRLTSSMITVSSSHTHV